MNGELIHGKTKVNRMVGCGMESGLIDNLLARDRRPRQPVGKNKGHRFAPGMTYMLKIIICHSRQFDEFKGVIIDCDGVDRRSR